MTKRTFSNFLIGLIAFTGTVYGANVISFIPMSNVEQFVIETLDLGSFRNSFGPRRTPHSKTLSSLMNVEPKIQESGMIEYENDDWFYRIEIKDRNDINKDGIEDLAICFTDRAKKGTYSAKSSLLVTRYAKNTPLIALDYEIDVCKP